MFYLITDSTTAEKLWKDAYFNACQSSFSLVSIGLVLVLPVNYNVNEQNVAAAFIPVSNFHLQLMW